MGDTLNNNVSALLPFLKWAGGKRWLSSELAPYLGECKGKYYEPFLGSGAVFFRYRPQQAVLADTNAELIECYQAIKDHPVLVESELISLSARLPETSYYDIRQERPESVIGRAARFLYLNRTCWNGLYRVNLRGEFNVPRGTKTQIVLQTDNFVEISTALKSASLRIADFEETIDEAGEGDLVFADPPYTVAHNMNGFVKYNQKIFSWDDQVRLATSLTKASDRGATVISTNADHPEVLALYKNIFNTKTVSRASIIAAAASNRRATTELFITNILVES